MSVGAIRWLIVLTNLFLIGMVGLVTGMIYVLQDPQVEFYTPVVKVEELGLTFEEGTASTIQPTDYGNLHTYFPGYVDRPPPPPPPVVEEKEEPPPPDPNDTQDLSNQFEVIAVMHHPDPSRSAALITRVNAQKEDQEFQAIGKEIDGWVLERIVRGEETSELYFRHGPSSKEGKVVFQKEKDEEGGKVKVRKGSAARPAPASRYPTATRTPIRKARRPSETIDDPALRAEMERKRELEKRLEREREAMKGKYDKGRKYDQRR